MQKRTSLSIASSARASSRRGHDWTYRVSLIADALKALPGSSAVIDGEGVLISTDGVLDFDELRAAVGRKDSRQAFPCAFDLLGLNGKDLRRESWETRRGALTRLLAKTEGGIRLSEHIDGPDARRQCGQLEPRRR